MAEFLKEEQLNQAIIELIDNADDYLWLISPYIKLHERIKDRLKALTSKKPGIDIIVVFGKNETNVSKSISEDDIEFLKSLPTITIGYEKRLHAKFYASEDFSLITSMNLHEFSTNNNIEAGIRLKSSKWLKGDNDTENKALNYFEDVIENCTKIFEKIPVGKSNLLSLHKTYTHSEIKTDIVKSFFKKEIISQQTKQEIQTGYCIRTGKPISFNLQKPMCKEAYDSWAQFKNKDYPEKFCHKTGKPSHGKTSMRNPIL
jgi:phosphatidylserine/phosphatidylglycerophosphate/cardiolipin synthase-like enzyme